MGQIGYQTVKEIGKGDLQKENHAEILGELRDLDIFFLSFFCLPYITQDKVILKFGLGLCSTELFKNISSIEIKEDTNTFTASVFRPHLFPGPNPLKSPPAFLSRKNHKIVGKNKTKKDVRWSSSPPPCPRVGLTQPRPNTYLSNATKGIAWGGRAISASQS